MIGKIKEIIRENQGATAIAGVVALGMYLSIGGSENLDNYDEVEQAKPKRKFTQLKNLDDIKDSYDPYAEIDEASRAPASAGNAENSDPGDDGGDDRYDPYFGTAAATQTGGSVADEYQEEDPYIDEFDPEDPRKAGPSYCEKYPYSEPCLTAKGGPQLPNEPVYPPPPPYIEPCGTLSVLPGDGAYVTNPYVAIVGKDVVEISYCFSKGGTCDPTGADGIVYDGNFQISTTPGFQDNGSFSLSFYATCAEGGTSTVTASYVVDDKNVPLSYYQTPIVQQLQTQETHQLLTTTSTAFGVLGYNHFTYNVGGYDPSAENCTDLSENLGFDVSTHGMRTIASVDITDTALLTPTDYISVPLNFYANPLITYGDNWLVSFMQFVDAGGTAKYGCLSNRVVLKDFTYMGMMITDNYQTPPVGGVHLFQGQIQNFGHFGGAAPSGPGVGRLGNSQLETDLVNIIN